MAFCQICGRPLGWWRGITGPRCHDECKQRQAVQQRAEELGRKSQQEAERQAKEAAKAQFIETLMTAAAAGDFSAIRCTPQIILDHEEVCYCVITGVRRAAYYPQADGTGIPAFTGEGRIRSDGILPKDEGALHLTSKRLCFAGKGGLVNLLLKKMLQCRAQNNLLCVGVEGRVTSSYFVLDGELATALCVAVEALAVQVKSAAKPKRTRAA